MCFFDVLKAFTGEFPGIFFNIVIHFDKIRKMVSFEVNPQKW
jgi:hypothetical protein